MAGIRNSHARPPVQKEAVMAEDIIAMIETLDRGTLRGLRDRAMLLIGYAGGLRRSEIVGLDLKADQTEDGRGWIEILDKGCLSPYAVRPGGARLRSAGRGSSDATYPVVAIETWIKFAKLAHGPLFRRVTDRERPSVQSG
jgi:integrase